MKIKKQKAQKRVSQKENFQEKKFQDYTSCLEAVQFENKVSHLGKNKLDVDSLKEDQKEFIKTNKLIVSLREDQKEFIKNNKLILKTQQRFGL